MSALDDLLDKYATRGEEHHDTMAGYYSYYGFLGKFLLEAVPLIEAAVRSDQEAEQKETPEQAAERFVLANGDRYIQAIKDFRMWAQSEGLDYGLKLAKDACDAARARLRDRGVLLPLLVRYGTSYVPSFTDPDLEYRVTYKVYSDDSRSEYACTCPAFHFQGQGTECKHIESVKQR